MPAGRSSSASRCSCRSLLEWSVQVPDARALAPLVLPGAASTGLASVMYLWIIREAGPARALLVTYLTPAVALALGAAVLDERLSAISALGLPLILIGITVASRN